MPDKNLNLKSVVGEIEITANLIISSENLLYQHNYYEVKIGDKRIHLGKNRGIAMIIWIKEVIKQLN